MPDPDFLSIKEFASKVQVHPDTIRRSIKAGKLSAFRLGIGKRATYRIPISEINRIASRDMEDLVEKLIEKRLQEIRKLL